MRFSFLSAASMLLASFGVPAFTATAQTNEVNSERAPVLAELFTSQSCSSCPPAERLFNELVDTKGVVAIQWHVDYWDNLVHGRNGKWKDPYSSAANTRRQRDYNYALRGTGSVYTPQAIIGGVSETTGSRAESVARLISSAPAAEAKISFSMDEAGYAINVTSPNGASKVEAETIIIRLLKQEDTEIAAGENKGLFVNSRNVAVSSDTLGAWTGQAEIYRAETMGAEYTCAVIVQGKDKGRVLGAAYCPG